MRTAIWFTGVNRLKEDAAGIPYRAAEAVALIDPFLECTDHEFQYFCIVGRRFARGGDHSCPVSQGGCSKILDALVAR